MNKPRGKLGPAPAQVREARPSAIEQTRHDNVLAALFVYGGPGKS